ncbi:hypothetical protein CALVIDRAFT_536785 [Calocera viscosa TUFC12733]|uniref:N-acetyltransferase domain-containing protein n=1 Tax=Calocera viscosa (strain TUFC12733) TaxID=1330018 RepID=A0A167MM97_CALVF|nr:hypothetical protein CALVIDRAFT_536785 [Calocera viscosa TUFC12733]
MSTNSTITAYTYTLSHALPRPATYRHLRTSCGLSDKSTQACLLGLPRSVFCVLVLADPAPGSANTPASTRAKEEGEGEGEQPDPRAVGIGRLIGDSALFLQIVDIAVLPAHQKRGLGKLIMRELMRWVEEHVPETGYVSLIADGEARRLYSGFGFVETEKEGSVGMALRVGSGETKGGQGRGAASVDA